MWESGAAESSATSSLSCQKTGNSEDKDGDGHNSRLPQGDEVLTDVQAPATPSRFWSRQRDSDEPEVLQPDHPLMKGFQAALKDHLQRQYNRLTEEILDLVSPITM